MCIISIHLDGSTTILRPKLKSQNSKYASDHIVKDTHLTYSIILLGSILLPSKPSNSPSSWI